MRNPFGNISSGGPRFPFGTVDQAQPAPPVRRPGTAQHGTKATMHFDDGQALDVDSTLQTLTQLQIEENAPQLAPKPAGRKRGPGGKFAKAGE